VTVIVLQYLYTDWYPRQIRDRTEPGRQRPFDARFAAEIYSTTTPLPEQAVSLATDEVLTSVRAGPLPEDLSLSLDSVLITYPSGFYLDRGLRIALSIINETAGRRPIYFASSAGLIRSLGLSPWGVRHGLATKLVMRDIEADTPDGWIQGSARMGEEWFDVERNMTLVRDVYRYRGLKDRELLPDRSTLSIPMQFQLLFVQLADVAALQLRPSEEVAALAEEAASMQVTALGGRRYLEQP
jgi:hypothetical protein